MLNLLKRKKGKHSLPFFTIYYLHQIIIIPYGYTKINNKQREIIKIKK